MTRMAGGPVVIAAARVVRDEGQAVDDQSGADRGHRAAVTKSPALNLLL